MKTFAACGFEMKIVNVSTRKFDNCGRTRAVGQVSADCSPRSSALPSVGITKHTDFVALLLRACGGSGHAMAQAIGCLGRFDDRGSRINLDRTLANREVISGRFL